MPNVDLLFGPMLIGAFFNTILYGVLLVQAFIYWRTYTGDASWIRYFILYLVICETLNTGFDIEVIYEPFVQRYGTPDATTFVPIMVHSVPIVTAAISTPVQIFIAWRIRVMSGSHLLASIVYFFAICSFIGALASTIGASFLTRYDELQTFAPALITWLASSAVADVAISVILVWCLYKRRTGHARANVVIDRVIRLTVQTGVITAISAILDVVLFTTVTHSTLNFVWDFALGKLYTNSLLSTLNARRGWGNLNYTDEEDNVLFGRNVQSLSSDKQRMRNSTYTSTAIELSKRGTHSNSGNIVEVTKVVEVIRDAELV